MNQILVSYHYFNKEEYTLVSFSQAIIESTVQNALTNVQTSLASVQLRKRISMATCYEHGSRIQLLSYIAKEWDVFLVGAGMIVGFTVVVLKLTGFF